MKTAIAKQNRFFKDVPVGTVFSTKGSYYLKVDDDATMHRGYMHRKTNGVSILTGSHSEFGESEVVAVHPDATLVIDYHGEDDET